MTNEKEGIVLPTYIVTNADGSECVGFDDLGDAMFAAGEDELVAEEHRGFSLGFSTLAHHWRERLMDEDGKPTRILLAEYGAGNADQLILEVEVYAEPIEEKEDE